MILGFQGKMLKKKIWTNSWASLQVTKVIRLKRKKCFVTVTLVLQIRRNQVNYFWKRTKPCPTKNSFHGIWPKDYENMTGQKLSLSGNEVGLFAKNDGLKGQKALTLNDHQFSVKEEFNKDFIVNHVPNKFNILTTDYNYLVVPDLQAFWINSQIRLSIISFTVVWM